VSTLAYALDQAIDGIGRERSAPLSLEYIPPVLWRCGAQFVATDRMRGRLAVLSAADMCKVAVRLNSICDHSRSQSSIARSPWR